MNLAITKVNFSFFLESILENGPCLYWGRLPVNQTWLTERRRTNQYLICLFQDLKTS